MRPIDADELKDAIKAQQVLFPNIVTISYHNLNNIIDNAPTVISDSLYDAYCKMNDEEFEHTESFTVKTPKGKIVKFAKEKPQGEWIPISDGLPEYTGLYLVSIDDVVTVANFTGNYFMHRGGGRVEVYAWQSLPEPYKKCGAE